MSPVSRYEVRDVDGGTFWVARRRTRIDYAPPVVTPPTNPTPPTSGAFSAGPPEFYGVTGNLLPWHRSFYPGPGHPLGDWRTWPEAYWLPPTPAGNAYTPPAGVTVWRTRNPRIPATAKFRVRCPVVFEDVSGPPHIDGGLGLVIQGLLVKNNRFIGSNLNLDRFAKNADGSFALNDQGQKVLEVCRQAHLGRMRSITQPSISNQWVVLKGNSEASSGAFTALEGSGVIPGNDGFVYVMEGLNYDGKGRTNDTLVVQNCRVGSADLEQGITAIITGEDLGGHYGGDIAQPISGPSTYIRLGLSANSNYQGEFLQNSKFGDGAVDYLHAERIQLVSDIGDPETGREGGQAYMFWDANPTATPRFFGEGANGYYIRPNPDRPRNRVVWDSDAAKNAKVIVGEAPREFVPLSTLATYNSNDPRWSA